MIKIENIVVEQKYSISIYFDKGYTKENVIFGSDGERQAYFRGADGEIYEEENYKRNFGTLVEDGLAFAVSDDLNDVRNCALAFAEILSQGRGLDKLEPHKAVLFRIYNSTDNVLERYVILKLWHECLLRHREVNKIANTMRRRQWEQIGAEYGTFAERMLMPFEKKFTSAADVGGYAGIVRIEALSTEKVTDCVYTFENDILPMYVLYMTELARRGKHICTCEVCGRDFVASRKDTRVCGEKCKSRRQAGYFKEHKEKVKDDVVDITYQRNRDGYDNFLKKLARLNAPDDMVNSYKETKYDFLENGKKKRKAYKDGELKKSELLDWIRADRGRRLQTEQDILEKVE